MAYIPTVWESGDVVTSEKLNKLENGVESASVPESSLFIITMTENSETQDVEIDKTFTEIFTAYNNNKLVVIKYSTGDSTTINDTIYNLVHVENGGNSNYLLFMGNLYISSDGVYYEHVQINDDNTINFTESTYPSLE